MISTSESLSANVNPKFLSLELNFNLVSLDPSFFLRGGFPRLLITLPLQWLVLFNLNVLLMKIWWSCPSWPSWSRYEVAFVQKISCFFQENHGYVKSPPPILKKLIMSINIRNGSFLDMWIMCSIFDVSVKKITSFFRRESFE